jgi:hypothetical protein
VVFRTRAERSLRQARLPESGERRCQHGQE